MAQAEITIRLVLPEGVAAPDPEVGRPHSLCTLLGAMVYTLFPAMAQDVEVDVEVGVAVTEDAPDDRIAPVLRVAEFPVTIDSEFGLSLAMD